MFLKLTLSLMFIAPVLLIAQDDSSLEIDFLSSYYDQDGDHSPVNGGRGSEELQSISPIIVVRYRTKTGWDLASTFGVDNVTSASIDAMDDNAGQNNANISSASRKDNRAFTHLSAGRAFGSHNWTFSLGFSTEYDYKSLNGGLSWSRDFNQKNTTLAASVHHYADTIDLYNIHGINEAQGDRDTTDLSLSLSHVFTPKMVGSLEVSVSDQSGYLSSPFQEVILSNSDHVAERLPDNRQRTAVRLSLNRAFGDRVVTRFNLRAYDDDFDISATTLELEPHIKLKDHWIYPILRFHTQDGSKYYASPGTFSADDDFYTADGDLATFDSTKFGLGARFGLNGRHIKSWDIRATVYDRDDG